MRKSIRFLSLISLMTLVGCGGTTTSSETENSSSKIIENSSEISSEVSVPSSEESVPSSEEVVSSSEEAVSSSEEEVSSEETSSIPEDLEHVSRSELVRTLSSTKYTEPITCDENIGLTAAYNVGVDEDKLNNETLYPVPTEGVTVYELKDYNVTPQGTDNARYLNNLISDIKNNDGIKVLKFESGTYNFRGVINVVGAKNIYFAGNNTKWVLTNWTSYIDMADSSNIHVNGITFDMNPSPTIAGTVKSFSYDSNGNCDVVLSIFDEFDLTASAYNDWDANKQGFNHGSYMECSLDPITNKYSPDLNKNLMYNTTSSDPNVQGMKKITINAAAQEVTVKLSKNFPWWTLKNPTIGSHTSLAFTMYEFFGFCCENCENIYFEHTDTYVTAGMGFRTNGGKNFYLNHCNFMQDPNSTRIMTCTADIIHSCATEGDLKITNCILESSHDDALNIKSFYGKVTSVVKSSRELVIQQTQNETCIKFEEGDVVDFYDPATLGFVDRYTIVESSKSGTTYTIKVDRRPNNILEGYSAGNDTRSVHMYLHNCVIQNKRNRGILLQTRYSELSNCTFYNVIMGAIQVLTVGDSNREAICPVDVVLKNNKIMNCRGGDINIFAYGTTGKSIVGSIKNITCQNNYLFDGNGNTFSVRSGDGINISNNLVHFTKRSDFNIITVQQTCNSIFNDNAACFNGSYAGVNFVALDTESTNITQENNKMYGGI